MTAREPTDAEVAEIARGLTKAAQAAILAMEEGWQAGPTLWDVILDSLDSLRGRGLVERTFGDMSEPTYKTGAARFCVQLSACWWFRLTPLGLRVRAHLLAEGRL